MPFDEKNSLLSREGLCADDVGAGDFDGDDALVVKELPGRLGRLLALLLGSLDSDQLVSLLGHDGLDLPAVRSLFFKLFTQLELELHRLQHGRGLDGPFAVPLRKAATASPPVMTVSEENGEWTIKTSTMLKSMELKFKLGEEFEEKTPDGREVKAVVTQEGDKLITVQTAKKEGEKSTKSTREFFDDKCIVTIEITGTDVVCTQTFTRSLPSRPGSSSTTSASSPSKSPAPTSSAHKPSRESKLFFSSKGYKLIFFQHILLFKMI